MTEQETFLGGSEDSIWHHVLLGSVSGTTVVMVGHPLDTLKVRLQTNATKNLFRDPYKGVLAPLLAVTPSWVGSYAVYGTMLGLLGNNDMRSVCIAGGVSGAVYSMIVTPFELVKCNAQKAHMGTLATLGQLHKSVGITGIYRGLGAGLTRDVSQSVAYYACAEMLNRSAWLNSLCGPNYTAFVAGALTGVCHCTVEYTPDIIKTRFQTNLGYRSYRDVIRDMTILDWRRAFTGYPPWIARSVIAHGCSFFAIDALNKFVLRRRNGDESAHAVSVGPDSAFA